MVKNLIKTPYKRHQKCRKRQRQW